MKINKNIKRKSVLNLKLITEKIFNNQSLDQNLSLKATETRLKHCLKILYDFHVKDKKILFIGNFRQPKTIKTVLRKTKHNFFPSELWIKGGFSNPKTLRHLEKKPKKIKQLDLFRNLRKKFDLIILLDNSNINIIKKEIIKLKIPLIIFKELKQNESRNYNHIAFGNFNHNNDDLNYKFLFSMFTNLFKKGEYQLQKYKEKIKQKQEEIKILKEWAGFLTNCDKQIKDTAKKRDENRYHRETNWVHFTKEERQEIYFIKQNKLEMEKWRSLYDNDKLSEQEKLNKWSEIAKKKASIQRSITIMQELEHEKLWIEKVKSGSITIEDKMKHKKALKEKENRLNNERKEAHEKYNQSQMIVIKKENEKTSEWLKSLKSANVTWERLLKREVEVDFSLRRVELNNFIELEEKVRELIVILDREKNILNNDDVSIKNNIPEISIWIHWINKRIKYLNGIEIDKLMRNKKILFNKHELKSLKKLDIENTKTEILPIINWRKFLTKHKEVLFKEVIERPNNENYKESKWINYIGREARTFQFFKHEFKYLNYIENMFKNKQIRTDQKQFYQNETNWKLERIKNKNGFSEIVDVYHRNYLNNQNSNHKKGNFNSN